MIRRCSGVGDLYSSRDGVDSWVDTHCPLITPTLCIYTYVHCVYTYIHVYVWHGVVCVARMMYGAPDIPKLRATLATSRRRHSLNRDWNICKCSQDDQHIIFGKKYQEKRRKKSTPLYSHLAIFWDIFTWYLSDCLSRCISPFMLVFYSAILKWRTEKIIISFDLLQ